MNIKQNKARISTIINRFPKNEVKNCLIEKFALSPVSIHRRMRGQIPFTFEEVTELSLLMGFSVDELIMESESRSWMKTPDEKDAPSVFLYLLQQYSLYFEWIGIADKILFSMNRIDFFMVADYDLLFKLFYYKCLRLENASTIISTFSQTEVPDAIESMRLKLSTQVNQQKKVDFIIQGELFLNLCREIRYLHKCKLLSTKETEMLQNELKTLLNDMSQRMQQKDEEIKHDFYLSMLDVEYNTICTLNKTNYLSLFQLPNETIIVKNKNTSLWHWKWFEYQKKHSVLITWSNELMQAEFVENQSEYINHITETHEKKILQGF